MPNLAEYLTLSANVSRSVTEGHKVYIALLAMVLALLWPGARNRSLAQATAVAVGIGAVALSLTHQVVALPFAIGVAVFTLAWPVLRDYHQRAAPVLLSVLTAISIANYARWGTETAVQKLDVYDVMHYYVNAKYFDELGYLDLYPAVMLADHENNGPAFDEGNKYLAQDGNVHVMRPISHGLARGRVVKSNAFTPERWKEFEHDVLYIQRTIPGFSSKLWRQMIQDHGFNGTPVWTMLARPVATMFPVESLKLLCHIDTLFLLAAFLALGWAYGRDTAMWAAVLLLTSYSARWPTISWSFFRYDWVAGLLIAMALLKKNHPYIAGLFTAWSATLRFFPAFWMWGPFFKGVAGLIRGKLHKSLLLLALGFVVGVAIFELGAVAKYGTEPVKTHFENMLDHNSAEQLSSRRIGLASALAYNGPFEPTPPKFIEKWRKEKIGDQKTLRYALALVIMVIMGWALRHTRDDEAFGWGFVPIFLLTTMSYYYYVARVTLSVVHAAELDKFRNRFGLAFLFGIELFSNFSEFTFRGHRVFLVGNTAWLLGVYVLVMMALLLFEASATEKEAA